MMHLTNYAINKRSKNFVKGEGEDDDTASKRSIASTMKSLEEAYGVSKDKIWDGIKDIINKTIISAQPELSHIYKSSQSADRFGKVCFQILGFDIMLDHKVKPWLLEVNASPSFNLDTKLDKFVKMNLISDTFKIIEANFSSKQKYTTIEKLDG